MPDLGIPMPKPVQDMIDRLLAQGNLAAAANAAATMAVRQAQYDTAGLYPSFNVMPYWYGCSNVGSNSIGANATVNNSIKITAEAAFVCTDLRVVTTGALRIFARVDASDRQLMNQPMNIANVAGTAQRPGFLAKPWLIPANSTISFDFTDISGSTNTIELTLNGFKLYNFGIAS